MCQRKLPVKPVAKKRWSLSEIGQPFYCSIIGTCFTLDELASISKRLGMQAAESDYDLHIAFIERLSNDPKANRVVSKKLDRKFQRSIRRFQSATSQQELLDLWAEAREEGKVSGAYWAVLTHPVADADVVGRAFGDIHMLSHVLGASRRVDMRVHCRLERQNRSMGEEIAALRKTLDASRRETRAREQELWAEKQRARAWEETCSELQRHNEELTQAGTGTLRAKIESEARRAQRAERQAYKAEQDCQELQRRLREADQRCSRLQEQGESLRDEIARLETKVRHDPGGSGATAASRAGQPCLRGRTVLYVGGRTHLLTFYREFVERRGGVFLHHDGNTQNDRLTDRVSRADIVCCPVDCVSHSACLRVKRCCRQQSKGCAFLRSSGLSSLVAHLDSVAGPDADAAA